MASAATLHQPSLTGGEVSPSLYGRVDLARYQTSLRTCRNAFVKAEGGVSKRGGTRFVAEPKFHGRQHRLVEFQFSTEQNYILEIGHNYMRVIRDGGLVTEAAITITAASQADPCVITATAHGFSNDDHVIVSGISGMTELNGRQFVVSSVTANTFEISTVYGDAVDSSGFAAYASGGSVARIYELAMPYAEAFLFDLKLTQSADVMYIAHPGYGPRQLSRTTDTDWTIESIDFVTDLEPPTITGAVWTGTFPDGTTFEKYVVTSVNSTDNEESIASPIRTTIRNSVWTSGESIGIGWTAVVGATDFNIYKELAGVYGFIGTTTANSFSDTNIIPDTTDTPPEARNPFANANNPGTVAFFEDRLSWAGSNSDPQTVWMSSPGNYDQHNISTPPQPDNAVEFTINSRQVNRVLHMLALRDLLLMTSNSIWAASGQGERSPITPSSIWVRAQTYDGVANVEPIIIGDSALYVEDKNNAVRDLFYEFSADGYRGTDVSILARHLFDGRSITDWAYARAPESIIWAARDDGKLLGLTYVRDQQVWGWHQHDTLGEFESVATAGNASEDVVYLSVKRTFNGRTFRCIEEMQTRLIGDQEDMFLVDCGLKYDGAATTTFSGLWHLEGREVVGLADGNVIKDITVTNGAVTLPFAASTVIIGLPYEAEIETLEYNAPAGDGPLLTKKRAIGRVFLQVNKTRGLHVADGVGELEEIKDRSDENYGDPIRLQEGLVEVVPESTWEGSGRIRIVSQDPLPFEVLSIMPELAVGG